MPIDEQQPERLALMPLKSMAFAHLPCADDTALALANVWFGELSGSVDARHAQREARRQLALLIRARMNGPTEERTMADVISDARLASAAQDRTGYGNIGLQLILLNVTESRAALYAELWRRHAQGRP
jgi:hypothetical protein